MKAPTRTFFSATLLLLLLTPATAANWTVFQGDKVTIADANSTIKWGRNYTFNASGIEFYTDSLEINMTDAADRNISITSNTPETINSTLFRYDLSTPSLGDTLIKVQTSAVPGSTVNYRFTGIPSISQDHYVLKVDGSQKTTFNSGGTITWSHSDWSTHNFTLTYQNKPTGGDDDSSGGGHASSIPVLKGKLTDSHTWLDTNKTRFTLETSKPGLDLKKVTVQTRKSQPSFSIQLKQHPDKPTPVPRTDNAYTYFQIETPGTRDAEIKSTTIRFTVNKTWAQQYQEVVTARLENNDEWNQLPAQPIEKNGRKWTYEASTTGFSYYTIIGKQPITQEQERTQEQEKTEKQKNQTQKQPGRNEKTGNQTTPGKEDQREQKQRKNPVQSLLIAVSVLAVTAAAGFLGYRYWSRRQAEKHLEELANHVRHEVEDHELDDPGTVYRKLDEAEQALENNNYREVERLLEEIDRRIQPPL